MLSAATCFELRSSLGHTSICTRHFLTYVEVWPGDDRRSKHVAGLNIINNEVVLGVYIVMNDRGRGTFVL